MKKIIIALSIVISSALFCISCSDDDYKAPEVTSDKYRVETETFNNNEIASIHAKASNIAGGVNVSIPNEDGTTQTMFIKNEELESMLKTFLAMQPEVSEAIKRLNYIDFISNQNLVISYNDEKGSEMIIPNMLKEDGSLAKGLKYRKSFDRIFIRISERLTRFLDLPVTGELPETHSLLYKTTNNGCLISVNKTALNSYVEMLSGFGVDKTIVTMIKDILSQYSKTGESIEIGIYLQKIK